MHYKDGTEAKIGDEVHGRGYNVKREITGVVVHLTPGAKTCNLTVMHAARFDVYGGQSFPQLMFEYGQCDHFERCDLREKRLQEEAKAVAP